MAIFLVEGQTAPVDYALLADKVPYPLTGYTVETIARTTSGVVKELTGTTSILSAVDGTVRFSPGSADLLASDLILRVRFKVTRADGKVEFFPTGEPESWVIQK